MTTREQDLRAALGKAELPLATRWLISRLIDRADYGTAVIPDKFRFAGGLAELADYCRLPKSTIVRSLKTAEHHGWITRHHAGPGRGHATGYQLAIGTDCLAGCPCTRKSVPSQDRLSRESVSPVDRDLSHSSRNAAGQAPEYLEGTEGEGKKGPEVCTVCGLVLDPVLPANGYQTHPCCDPSEVPRRLWLVAS